MCVVSMIMDHYGDKWENQKRKYEYPSPEDIEEFTQLLALAREYDKKHNQADCELEGKKQRILDLARELGVEITFL